MTLDEFEQEVDNIGKQLVNLTPILTDIGQQMTNELRIAAPEADKDGGALKGSISLEVQPTQFSITMLDYGAYQNYGVKGVGKAKYSNQVPSPFNNDKQYEFGTGSASKGGRPWGAYYSGLGPHIDWFNMGDITEEVTRRLQTAINNTIQ